jgi:hypothetical protein
VSRLPLALALATLGCATGGGVFTQHNDNARTGAVLDEVVLDTHSVKASTFGRVARLPLRGSLYAQPLYVPAVAVSGGRQDLVIVATMHNQVYAFAADGRAAPVWGPVSLGPPVALPDREIGGTRYRDIYGEVGVMSTPVVDPARGALFVVAATKEGGAFVHRLHRLDLATGAAQRPPVVIAAPGFLSQRQSQRSALLLSRDKVYVAFASYGDRCPYAGWVLAYDAETLAQRQALATSAGEGVGIWMGGQGPAADEHGDLYLLTSNRILDQGECPQRHPVDLSNSIVKLGGDNLAPLTSFTPANNKRLNDEDGDLGGAGALLVPGTDLVLGAGKEARVFLVDRRNMGGFAPDRDDRQPGVVQRFFANRERCPKGKLGGPECHHIHSTPIVWDGPSGPWIYVWPENDYLKAYRFDRAAGKIDCRGAPDPDCDPISLSTTRDPGDLPGGSPGMPGGFLSLSAHGKEPGSGIIWAFHPWDGNANQKLVDGVLRAYDASDLSRELWSTMQNRDRDELGPYPKFSWPTIADGRVYAATFAGLAGRVRLEATSGHGPALAGGPGVRLYLAWTADDGQLRWAASANGRSFSEPAAGPGKSLLGPALAGDERAVYLAWVAPDGAVQVGRGRDPGGLAPVALDARTEAAPALAAGGGRLFVAWRTGGALHVARADASADRFEAAQTFAEPGFGSPSLAFVDGKLLLAWATLEGRLVVAEVSASGLGARRVVDESSGAGPALVGARSSGARAADLHLFWAAGHEPLTLNVRTADEGAAFSYKLPFEDETSERPAAASVGARLFVAWRDDSPAHHLHVARYNPGELSVYGLLGRR